MKQKIKSKANVDSPLRPEVAVKYFVPPGVLTRFVCAEFGEVDLTKIHIDFAEQLEKKGYLQKLS